ncbi:MAG TPA: hypothetical protein VJ044_17330, partial [Candidatus Hodarchaeales archaeon]|nr:hypothetical protein [Candidatus Hodarchaeales archaeon]
RIGGLPLYLLYNFASRPSRTFTNCGVTHDWNQFGCSFASAFYVEQLCVHRYRNGQPYLSIPYFNDFHPANAIPWIKIACCPWLDSKTISQIVKPPPGYPLKGQNLGELISSTHWINVTERERIALDYKAGQGELKAFAPRFRLFLSIERVG